VREYRVRGLREEDGWKDEALNHILADLLHFHQDFWNKRIAWWFPRKSRGILKRPVGFKSGPTDPFWGQSKRKLAKTTL